MNREISSMNRTEGKYDEKVRRSSVGCYRITPQKGKRSMKHRCIKAATMCISLILTGVIVSCIGGGKLMNRVLGKKEAYLHGTCE
ncbi:MAG: hypothetical protein E7256_00460 [Lachnospiraceae bacterium]|nr:hypothetical protein [Lachnospiraceae bacterium]